MGQQWDTPLQSITQDKYFCHGVNRKTQIWPISGTYPKERLPFAILSFRNHHCFTFENIHSPEERALRDQKREMSNKVGHELDIALDNMKNELKQFGIPESAIMNILKPVGF